MISLGKLPKLKDLELRGEFEGVTGKIFKYFTTLKSVTFEQTKIVKDGFCDLVGMSKDLEEIRLDAYSNEDFSAIVQYVGKPLRERRNNVHLVIWSEQCIVRILPISSQKDFDVKLTFEIYTIDRWYYGSNIKKYTPIFTTNDEERFIKEVLPIINSYDETYYDEEYTQH